MRLFNTAEVIWATTFNSGYSSALSYMAPVALGHPTSTAAGLVDGVLATGSKSGYTFSDTPSTNTSMGRTDSYSLNADPTTPGTSGTIHYYTDQSGILHPNPPGTAGPSDSPVGGSSHPRGPIPAPGLEARLRCCPRTELSASFPQYQPAVK